MLLAKTPKTLALGSPEGTLVEEFLGEGDLGQAIPAAPRLLPSEIVLNWEGGRGSAL